MRIYFFTIGLVFLQACSYRDKISDAYGNFEAKEILVSAESSGRIISLQVEEGAVLKKGINVGCIDTVGLLLEKKSLKAKIKATQSKIYSLQAQINIQKQQKENLLIEKHRIENLLKDQASTTKQLDDIIGKIKLVEKQKALTESQQQNIHSEIAVLKEQEKQIQEKTDKCKITNPVSGTVLTAYAEEGEVVVFGKALYKIADLSQLCLKAYFSGAQLSSIALGEKVRVLVDEGEKNYKEYSGTVTWIAAEAEFTPKTIQTKKERVNLVYAVKIMVKNDGSLKIGMPGEVRLN